MTQPLPPYQPFQPQPPGRRRVPPGWAKGIAVTAAALVLVGAGVGVGMAATGDSTSGMRMSPSPTTTNSAHQPGKKGKHGKSATPDPARAAWARKYGVNRDTMPNLAPVASATAQQRAAATALLKATEAATAKYGNLATAKAAGYDLQASLAKREQKTPRLAQAIKQVDAGRMPMNGRMPMLHVGNTTGARTDGKVLDPNAPETLMYEYTGHGNWKLIGVMYTANEAYPKAPPDPGGPITRWHYHPKAGGQHLMMHVFFVPDLAHAYAAEMT